MCSVILFYMKFKEQANLTVYLYGTLRWQNFKKNKGMITIKVKRLVTFMEKEEVVMENRL